MNYVMCSKCGKQVSNKTVVDLIVRAFVECSECIKKEVDKKKGRNDESKT